MSSIPLVTPQTRSSQPLGAALGLRLCAPWLAAALLGIILLIVFVDGPAAEFVIRMPDTLKSQIAAAAAPFKGTNFLILSLAALAVSLAAMKISAGDRRLKLANVARDAGFVFAATLLALVCATILKILIGRARPELLALVGPHAFSPISTTREWTSMPSGETSMTCAFFGAGALLAWRRGRQSLAGLLLLPATLIAISRPLVGAHFPSDVLAAMLLSAAVVLVLYGRIQRRRAGDGAALPEIASFS